VISKRYKQVLVTLDMSLKEAIKQMDKAGLQVLIVVDSESRILGIITDGDMRRAIINKVDFNEPVKAIMNKNPVTIYFSDDKNKALKLMKKYHIKHIPIVDRENKVTGLILWKDFLDNGEVAYPSKDTFVFIMAGGKGTRLDPFTKILPKPLIPIGEKPIIELVMNNFKKYGFWKFLVSVNYKAEMIKMYFSENSNNHKIDYIQEKNYLGTAGALSLAKDKLKDTFILSNCDVIIDTNFDSLLNYHKENKNKATILAVMRHVKVPYGILKIQNANLDEIIEKPEYYFIVNSGVYVLEPDIIDLIPESKPMDMPELLSLAKERRFKVQIYPINCPWFDIGEWEEYKRAIEYMRKYG